MTKYRARHIYFDLESNKVVDTNEARKLPAKQRGMLLHFDSQHEFAVFQILKNLPSTMGVMVHQPTEVIPRGALHCYPKGKKWKIDFVVQERNGKRKYIEAKGAIAPDFVANLTFLEIHNRNIFNDLWLVFPDKIPQAVIIGNLCRTPMSQRILTLSQLRKMTQTHGMLLPYSLVA